MKTGIKKAMAFALTLCSVTAGTIVPNAGKLLLSPTPIVAEATRTSDFIFTRRSVNVATLSGYTGTDKNITLPTEAYVGNVLCKITGIDQCAFVNNQNIESVTIPYGYSAIGINAFKDCPKLSKVSIPSSVCSIRDYAFQNTAITSIDLPSDLKILGTGAFSRCFYLTRATMPENELKALPDEIFSSCNSLKEFNIPSNIKKIGAKAFSNCSVLKPVTIPSGVTSIEDDIFYGCKAFNYFTIPQGVTSIGNRAFYGCTNLSSITIPSSVTYIGEDAFDETPWFKNHAKTNLLVIHNNIVIDGSSATRNVNIPSGVKCISAGAFKNNRSIQQVTMPSSVTKVGESAFDGCTNLSTVSLSSNIKEIPQYCFCNCKYLRTINFPNSVETIATLAFDGCKDLKSFRFPNNLKKIEGYAFRNCQLLSEITNVNTSKNYDIDGTAFEHCAALKKINGQLFVSHPSTGTIKFYNEAFVKKYFSDIEAIGFIQDFVEYKTSDIVTQIKNAHPNYNSVQMALALEDWMCQNGCSPFDKWEEEHGNKNYPSDIEAPLRYHSETAILLNGIGVCEGWAKGYNLLLRKAGISAEVASSTSHSWNIVYMDGRYFNIDSYWDDHQNVSTREYFMVSSEEIFALEKKNGDTRNCHDQIWVKRKQGDYYTIYRESYNCNTPMGDVNIDGKLDKTDVQWLLSYIKTGKDPDKWFNHVCADMNFDGKINATDLSLLKQKILKK